MPTSLVDKIYWVEHKKSKVPTHRHGWGGNLWHETTQSMGLDYGY